MSHTASVIRVEEATPIWVLGDQLQFMGSVEGTDLHVIDVKIPPGSGTPPHRHQSIEIFRVSEGEVTFGFFDGGSVKSVVAGPGTVVTVPANFGHNYQNRSAKPAAMTAIVEGQMKAFFNDVGSPVEPPPGPPSSAQIETLRAACQRHGIEIIDTPR